MKTWNFDTECKAPNDFVVNLFNKYLDLVTQHLGINSDQCVLKCVDDYHTQTYFLTNLKGKPLFVLKAITPISWDNSIKMVKREIEISEYAYHILEDMRPRRHLLFETNEDDNTGIIVYTYMGPAFTYENNPDSIDRLTKIIYRILFQLHSSTVSECCGFGSFTPIYDSNSTSSGDYSFRFLLQDIKRGNLDTTGNITQNICNKWIPKVSKCKKVSLTHADVTLSNVILSGFRNNDITLIDWTYSLWQSPVYDIANMFFWHSKYCSLQKATQAVLPYLDRYHNIDIEVFNLFPVFLARKFIDYGRFKAPNLIGHAQNLLELNDFEEVISYLNSTPVF